MSEPVLKVATIVGSTREGRFGGTVAAWFLDRAERFEGIEIDPIDLAEMNLSPVIENTAPPEVLRLRERLSAADAFVLITPEYNHGYPASLKIALDAAREEWMAKPLAFVSYGGMAGGTRAVEQLRQVCAELHMVTVRDGVSLHNCHSLFDADGALTNPPGPDHAASVMLDQLCWWGEALRAARLRRPYGS